MMAKASHNKNPKQNSAEKRHQQHLSKPASNRSKATLQGIKLRRKPGQGKVQVSALCQQRAYNYSASLGVTVILPIG
ncbi:hypothetical protein MLE32_000485 [Klebsiella aerogenes]|nr:hypothetical protein [Klebsiella aerogenes]